MSVSPPDTRLWLIIVTVAVTTAVVLVRLLQHWDGKLGLNDGFWFP